MTEALLSPRSPLSRRARPLAAWSLLAGLGLCAGLAGAAQALYAGPSTTPASSAARAPAAPPVVASSAAPIAPGKDTGGPRWAELSAPQKKVLAPLAPDWNGLDSRSKERWVDVAARFPKMPPAEQQRATQRMGEWAHMSVAQRIQARMNFQETRSVSKEEREARWKAYQALPEDKKRELATRAAAPASAASTVVAGPRRRPPPPITSVQPKSNVVGPAAPARAPAGSAALRSGSAAALLNRRTAPPPHQRDGQPKIAAGANSVDRTTLLPKHANGASGAAPTAPATAAHP